jgi:hypothetical protein
VQRCLHQVVAQKPCASGYQQAATRHLTKLLPKIVADLAQIFVQQVGQREWLRKLLHDFTSRSAFRAPLQNQLADMKGLRMTGCRIAFDTTQPQESEKQIPVKPLARPLRRKTLHQHIDLAVSRHAGEWDIDIRMRKITLKLRDLILEYGVIAEGIPSQLGNHTMVLVTVVQKVSKNQIGPQTRLERLEALLEIRPAVGKEAPAKLSEVDFALRPQHAGRCSVGFCVAFSLAGEYMPHEPQLWITRLKFHESAAAANLDVIAMGSEAQDGAIGGQVWLEVQHALICSLGTHSGSAGLDATTLRWPAASPDISRAQQTGASQCGRSLTNAVEVHAGSAGDIEQRATAVRLVQNPKQRVFALSRTIAAG